MTTFRFALVGDYDAHVTAHVAIPQALNIAAKKTGCTLESQWIGTQSLADEGVACLKDFHAVWCVPASPYASMEGALEAIRYVRETQVPFLGTCGGYQHAVLEYARNVLGYKDADNAEVNPDARMALVSAMSCALVEQSGAIRFARESFVQDIYGEDDVIEKYHCSYGINPAYLSIFDNSDLEFSGVDANAEPRAFELKGHPFFIGTAYQPERSALEERPHPLVTAFVQATVENSRDRSKVSPTPQVFDPVR